MMVVGFFTGARWSELSALRWDHFKPETKEIEIRSSQWRQSVRERPKAGRVRTAAFDEFIWSVMQEHRKWMMKAQVPGFDSGLCFPSDTGGYRHQSVLDKPFQRICEAVGIAKHLSSKCFRRTFNDLCRHARVDAIVLRSQIGHSDARMSEVYTSVDPSEKRNALAQVKRLVGLGNEQ